MGLYLNPLDRAIVLCVDEKSQVQALNRTEPLLPLAPGGSVRQSHDYERHGVTSLFAPMDVAFGVTISNCHRRHRYQEFLRFLNQIKDSVPASLEAHLVMDNYGTHKVAKVQNWLARHPRYHVHFTPTSGSWLNLVECLFAAVTERCVRRGATRQSACWKERSSIISTGATSIPSPSSGPRMRISSSEKYSDFVNAFLAQDTSAGLAEAKRLADPIRPSLTRCPSPARQSSFARAIR